MTTDPLILSIDQGSTGTKVICINRSAAVVASAYEPIRSINKQSGWVEHDPAEIWNSVVQSLEKLSKEISFERIVGIGITNQRETTLLWDRKTGEPYHNAISWQCRRSRSICDRFNDDSFKNEVRERTGSPLDAYYSATKIIWLFENISGLRKKAEDGEVLFGTIDSWLIWNLTGQTAHITDSSNASRTLLFNINSNAWDDFLLDRFEIPRQILPEVVSSDGMFGEVCNPELFKNRPPIVACLGDQQSSLFGQMCFAEGDAKCTLGTCLNLGINTGKKIRKESSGMTPTVAWNIGGRLTYKIEGGVYVAGSLLAWLIDKMSIAKDFEELTELASSVDSTEGVVFVPAFVGLAAPYWDMSARGTLVGLSFNHDKRHIARAAFEAIALQTYDVMRCAERETDMRVDNLRVGGGLAKNDLALQLLADMTQCSVQRPVYLESTSLGAAYLAGLREGFWGSMEELATHYRVGKSFYPELGSEEHDESIQRWLKTIDKSRG